MKTRGVAEHSKGFRGAAGELEIKLDLERHQDEDDILQDIRSQLGYFEQLKFYQAALK